MKNSPDTEHTLYMGLAMRKPVFRGLQTTKAQTLWSAPLLFIFRKVSYLGMLWAKLQISG